MSVVKHNSYSIMGLTRLNRWHQSLSLVDLATSLPSSSRSESTTAHASIGIAFWCMTIIEVNETGFQHLKIQIFTMPMHYGLADYDASGGWLPRGR